MKKLLVLLITLAMTLNFVACGGSEAATDATPSSSDENTSETIDFVEVTGNGLTFPLPADIEYVTTDEATDGMIYANEERTAVVTVSGKIETEATSADITEEDILDSLSAGGGLSDVTLDNYDTVEQDGGTLVNAFGIGTMENGTVMNTAAQYFFTADGSGYHFISYLYVVDAGTSLDDNITATMSTVKFAE